LAGLRRVISGFHQDDRGDWVAELSCLHDQHVRHRPPFQERPWVTTVAGRAARLGTEMECPRCDRAELPGSLHVSRTAGPFDATTLPAGLRKAHRVAEGVWGHLRVIEGSAGISLETDPPIHAHLAAGDSQPIPPGVPHAVSVDGPVLLAVDFLVPDYGLTVSRPRG
jgi:tellurite resistance-related uncharacterized protein